jgi:1-acyl-sn-glycerol-3-phosphate acyltransferase
VLLTKLGVPKLWGNDPERLWPYMRYVITPATMWLAPSVGYGLERVPLSGGAVVAANHLSAIDHPVMGALCPRTVYYMAKAELLEIPIVGEALRWTGAFSVRRGEGDREALRKACAIVREGNVVGVHLEGTRQRLGYPGEFKGGGLLIALRERVPVVPCGLETFQWSPRNRRPCAVVWGEPIDVTDLPRNRDGLLSATERVGKEIVRLWRQAAQAVVDRFPPETADGARRSGPIPGGWRPGDPFVDGVPKLAV